MKSIIKISAMILTVILCFGAISVLLPIANDLMNDIGSSIPPTSSSTVDSEYDVIAGKTYKFKKSLDLVSLDEQYSLDNANVVISFATGSVVPSDKTSDEHICYSKSQASPPYSACESFVFFKNIYLPISYLKFMFPGTEFSEDIEFAWVNGDSMATDSKITDVPYTSGITATENIKFGNEFLSKWFKANCEMNDAVFDMAPCNVDIELYKTLDVDYFSGNNFIPITAPPDYILNFKKSDTDGDFSIGLISYNEATEELFFVIFYCYEVSPSSIFSFVFVRAKDFSRDKFTDFVAMESSVKDLFSESDVEIIQFYGNETVGYGYYSLPNDNTGFNMFGLLVIFGSFAFSISKDSIVTPPNVELHFETEGTLKPTDKVMALLFDGSGDGYIVKDSSSAP